MRTACPSGSRRSSRPGRTSKRGLCGQGFCDAPGLKLIGAIDPSDIVQGKIGNCWRKLYEISRRASSWHTAIWQGSNVGYL